MLFKNSIPHLKKLAERWGGLSIIDSFGRDYGTLYLLKTLNGKPIPNMHHSDYLYIFRAWEKYLRLVDNKFFYYTQPAL